jgi:hypothetical protein
MPLVILGIPNPMIRKTFLPNLSLLQLSQAIRISTLNELHSPLQGDIGTRREQQMNMVRHDHKFMQAIFPLIAVAEQHLKQKPRPSFDTKDRDALPGNAGDEECTR